MLDTLLHQWSTFNPDDGKNDINRYSSLLRLLASECDHVTEFGTRNCVSSAALLSGHPKHMRCYDLVRQPNVDLLEWSAKELGVDFQFIQANTRQVEIEATELLFIDAKHTYSAVHDELKNDHLVGKYLVFHDTVECWERENGNPVYVEGIGRAIQELIAQGEWQITSRYTEGSGLMVLTRK